MKRPIGLAWMLGLLLLVSGCARQAEQVAPELMEPVGVKLDIQAVQRGDLYKLAVYDGEVVPYVQGLNFVMDGVFESMDVLPGAKVRAGQTLARMDESAIQEQYEALAEDIAHAERMYALDNEMKAIDLDIARLELDRLLAGYAKAPDEKARLAVQEQRAAIERMQLEMRQAQQTQALALETKRQKLQGLSDQLGRNRIVAPFDGRVIYIAVKQKGDRALASEPMVFLADDTRLSLQSVYISQTELRGANEIYARIGATDYAIEMNPVDMSEYISRMLAGASMELTYRFANPPEGLECGQYAAIYVVTGRMEDVLYIPSNALYSDASGRYVYRVVDGNRERCPVTTGGTNGIQTVITGGLVEGDYVYVKE